MLKTSRALLRWLAIGGLSVLLAILIPLTWITHKLTGGGLWIAERAKDRLRDLWLEVA